ncbi:MAG: sensor histidine kinase [Chloroflexota bacterium]|nr:sensor histidine kinase [Chloroflexota bacterium]
MFRDALLEAEDEPEGFKRSLSGAYHDHNWIEVRDCGHGMTRQELEEVFLTIGTRSRRGEKVDDGGRFVDPGRTLLGDKGVGRLSAMRLGDHMTVNTSRSRERYQNVLDIDWRRFSHESSELIEEVDVRPFRGDQKERRSDQGTTILIRNLRGDWDAGVFRRMVEEQFKRIIDPFPTSRSQSGWRDPNELFRLRFNGAKYEVPEIPLWLLDQAHAVVTARYELLGDGTSRLRGDIDYKLRNREKQFEIGEAELISIVDPIADREIRTGRRTLRDLGPFSLRFYWYNRRLLKEIPGIGNRREIVGTVNSWAGGLMVFRNFFRINPYGGQDDDWLELDKKALAARAYKVNRSQIVGQVSLTSRNFRLTEQTNREGLVENEFKQVLVGVLRHILITEFRAFITRIDKERKITDETTTDDLDHRIEETTSKIDAKILQIKRNAPEQTQALSELQQLTINLGRLIDQAKAMAKEYEDDRSKFVHLAGIGLMVEFILHEIGRTTARALDVLDRIDVSQIGRGDSAALQTLQDQLVTLRKRVNTLDPLSTSRRQTKDQFDLRELVAQVVEGRDQQLVRHRIEVNLDLPRRPYRIKAVKGMLLQIVENLFENSVYWLKIERRRRKRFEPRIDITVDATTHELAFSDNGPGVLAERASEVFEPFVTSKPPGQGRGLGLYISREMARYHGWELSLSTEDIDEDNRSSTFILEMTT